MGSAQANDASVYSSVSLYDRDVVDPQRLRVFRAVVQTGSINRAAARLGYTPSAVSQHVAALQRETGLVLVERHGRGIQPTAAGVTVADHATRVLDQLADFETLAGDLRAGRSGALRIGCFMSAIVRGCQGSSRTSPSSSPTCASS